MYKLIGTALTVCVMSVSSFALFTNGGFEDGNFTGWTVDYGTNMGAGVVDWNVDNPRDVWGDYTSYYGSGYAIPAQVVSAASDPAVSGTIAAYNGSKMAQLGNVAGYWHATKLSQVGTITQQDIDDNVSKLYVNWGALLDDPSHDVTNQPFFMVNVTVGGSTQSAQANATDAALNGWTDRKISGGYDPIWYKAGTFEFDVSGLALGTNVSVEMIVADCGYGGHGAMAFLDGIGTTYVPPSVPEPGLMSMILVGMLSLTGFAASRKRK